MNEIIMLFAGLFIGVLGTLGILRFYNWLNDLRHEVSHLYDKKRYLITEVDLMNEFLFWKKEQKKTA